MASVESIANKIYNHNKQLINEKEFQEKQRP